MRISYYTLNQLGDLGDYSYKLEEISIYYLMNNYSKYEDGKSRNAPIEIHTNGDVIGLVDSMSGQIYLQLNL